MNTQSTVLKSIPKSELEWEIHSLADGTPVWEITSNKDRTMYYIYSRPKRGGYVKKGKAKSPRQLYAIGDKLQAIGERQCKKK